jgi:hypothetical protein
MEFHLKNPNVKYKYLVVESEVEVDLMQTDYTQRKKLGTNVL